MSKRVRAIDTSAEHEPARGGEPGADADADATALLALGGEDDAHDDAQHEESEAKRARHGQGHHHEMNHEDAEMASAAAAAAEALADVHHNPHDEHPGSHHQGHHGGGQHGSHPQQYDPAHYQQHHQAYYGHHQQHHGQHPHYDYSAYAHPHEQQHHQHDQHAEAHQYHHPHHQEQQHQHQHEGHAQAQAHHAHAAAAAGEPSASVDADAAPAGAAANPHHTTAEASRDTKWSEMIDHLTTYATTHGHCDVPGRQPRLGPWVQIQRAQYRLYRDGKPSALTSEKVAKLEELGFRWQIARDRDSVWTEMLERWLAVRGSGKTNGGARVGQDPKLASWCKRQRKTYRLLGEGKPTPMKPEWAERLREVGFDFGDGASSAAAAGTAAAAMSAAAAGTAMDGSGGEEEEEGAAKPAAAADTNADANTDAAAAATEESIAAAGSATARDDDGTFQLRLAEVKQFVADHGPGVAIPDAYPSNEALGRWATQKRKQKRRADAGHTTRLTADRIAALDEAGFVWQVWGNRTEKWDEMFGRLVEFREQHGGSTRIVHSLRAKDPDLRQLGMWCDRQRAAYKARQQGKSGPMTDDRAKRLDDIGFEWLVVEKVAKATRTSSPTKATASKGSTSPPKKQNQRGVDAWTKRLEELKAYKEAHGDCLVPRVHDEDEKLSRWVEVQRQQYRNRQKGAKTTMTDHKIKNLEEVGFVFAPPKQTDQWTAHFNRLAKYREVEGHCRVPYVYPEDPSLGTWVDTCRTQYWRRKNGRSSRMTDKRIEMLEGLGFDWENPTEEGGMDISDPNSSSLVTPVYAMVSSRSAGRVTWEARFDELVAFKEKNGHCDVPNSYAQNKKLGSFVKKQREDYRKKLIGRKSPMSDTRIQKLEGIGFNWTIGKNKQSRGPCSWEQRLEELKAFKEQHGHCFVPRAYPENQALSYWVERQRQDYRNIEMGKPTKMVGDRFTILEQVGFHWNGSKREMRAFGVDVEAGPSKKEGADARAISEDNQMAAAGADGEAMNEALASVAEAANVAFL